MDTISVTLLCFFIISSWEFVEKVRKTSESVIPAKAGIQHINDFVDFNFLDPGFRRGDEAFFKKLLGLRPRVASADQYRAQIPVGTPTLCWLGQNQHSAQLPLGT